jgi:hypothetical protein
MWTQWQGNGPVDGQAPSVPVTSAAQAAGMAGGVPHPPQQELSDMLQILNQSDQQSFEELQMFNSFSDQ